jgi:glycosyltransferase involved in cell wall biosynthesis
MPVLNAGSTAGAAIQSILNQTFADWELLVIDDGSRDGTVGIVRDYSDFRIRIFSDGAHKGLVARLNEGIALSRGKYFARMDGDDVSYPERLAAQVEHLAQHPEIDLLGGGVLVFGHGGNLLGMRKAPMTHESICSRPWKGFYLTHPTWMGRTEWFREHRYCPRALRCEDQELLLRTYENSRFAALHQIVLGYNEEQLSLSKILCSRRHFAAAVFRRAIPKRQYFVAVAALIDQSVKGLVDSLAIGTGLNRRILRHRAVAVADEAVTQQWKKVWSEVQGKRDAGCFAAG